MSEFYNTENLLADILDTLTSLVKEIRESNEIMQRVVSLLELTPRPRSEA